MTQKTGQKLYRSQQEKILTGVCGGLAEYFNLDVTLVRLLFVFFTLINGSGLIIYLILSIITPRANNHQSVEPDRQLHRLKRRQFIGYLLIGLGLMFLIRNLMPQYWHFLNSRLIWPLLIIGLGTLLIIKKTKL